VPISPIYRPRVAAILSVPVAGSPSERQEQGNADSGQAVRLSVKVASAELELNDHNRADELRLTLDWHAVGLDVRLIRNATVEFYIGQADDFGQWTPTRRDLRFVGVVADSERHSAEGDPYQVDLRCLDYTDFFLRARRFGSKGIPDFSQTLDDAWRRIVSQTPGADVLRDRLLWIGDDSSRVQELRDVLSGKLGGMQNAPFPRLKSAVADRFAKLAKVPTKPETDAWAVWQQTIGMLGLISWVDRDYVVVSTSTNYYTETNAPVMVWGKNIKKLSESAQPIFRKGILLTSFDALTGHTIEARFHPDPFKPTAKGHRAGVNAELAKAEEWEAFAVPGITSPEILYLMAQRVHSEYTRQELQGTLVTGEMRTSTDASQQLSRFASQPERADFDLLELRAGDDIRVKFNDSDRDALLSLPDTVRRFEYLHEQGYSDDVAQILARNIESLKFFDTQFHVRRVLHRIEYNGDSGTYESEITYLNKISTGGADVGV
jgi:hypothetical protein